MLGYYPESVRKKEAAFPSSFGITQIMNPQGETHSKSTSEPIRSVGEDYKRKFGGRIQVLPVSTSWTCPNRLGLKGMQTCIFCDEWGSAAYPEIRDQSLKLQIQTKIKDLDQKYRNRGYLVYFQSYTNTFSSIQNLKEQYDTALSFPKVKGIIIGTRPDCLSKALTKLWTEYASKTYLSVELGVQTLDEDQLDFLKRGHSAEQSIEAIHKLSGIQGLEIGVHLMFGIPGESDEQIIETARKLSNLPIHNVKLHNLHVLKNTPLESMFKEGRFEPVSLEDYSRRTTLFLSHLSPKIRVQRLAALSSNWEELVAPDWTRHKLKVRNHIINHMKSEKIYQGIYHQKGEEHVVRI